MLNTGLVSLVRRRDGCFLVIVYIDANGKSWAIDSWGNKAKINNRQLIFQSLISINTDQFNWLLECECISSKIDLPLLWEMSKSNNNLSIEELAVIYYGDKYNPKEFCGLLLSLYSSSISYFRLNDDIVYPETEMDISQQHNRQENLKKLNNEQNDFRLWILKGSKIELWTDRQIEWLETLKEFVIFGVEFVEPKKIRKFLTSLKFEGGLTSLREEIYDCLIDRKIISSREPMGKAKLLIEKVFPEEIIHVVENIPEFIHLNNRKDLTNIDVITIDESSTMDIDDGLSIQSTEDGYMVGIHITDVTSIFSEKSSIDNEAQNRLSSFYAPEITIPMLPERISQNIGSLIPGVIRPAMSLLINFHKDFIIKNWEIVLSNIKSHKKLNYQEVDNILDHKIVNGDSDKLKILYEISKNLHTDRMKSGGIEFNRPEIKFEFNKDQIYMKTIPKLTPSRRMVSELMILFNTLLAEMCSNNNIPTIYRSSVELKNETLVDTSVDALRNYFLLSKVRSVAPSTTCSPHFLLGVDKYIQVTSPLRRYGDLLLQRQISHFLENGVPLYDKTFLDRFINDSLGKIRDITRAESDRKLHWACYVLSRRIHEIFSCIALEWRDSDLLVEFQDFPIKGIVKTKNQVNLGEIIEAKLIEVNLWQRKTILSA